MSPCPVTLAAIGTGQEFLRAGLGSCTKGKKSQNELVHVDLRDLMAGMGRFLQCGKFTSNMPGFRFLSFHLTF